jgi:hypothetical protein
MRDGKPSATEDSVKIQLRIIGEDLASFHARLSRQCWSVLAPRLADGGLTGDYRALNRRLKAVLSRRIEARQYCGQAFHCDAFLNPVDPGTAYRKSVPPHECEHTNHYLLTSVTSAGQLIGELAHECLAILSEAKHGANIRGAGRSVRRTIRDLFRDHLYRNEACGETPLCSINEPVSPWLRHAMPGSEGQFSGKP